jgi:predicted Zn-dependent peptidase
LLPLTAAVLAAGCGVFGGGGEPAAPEALTPEEAARRSAEALADSLLRRDGPPVGRDAVASLEFEPLRFKVPEPERFELSNGVPVFFLRDPALPLVDVFVDVRGGYIHFDREQYGASAALLPMMRHGGTESLTPDSVDEVIEFNALGISTSTNGGRMRLAVSGLRHQLDLAMGLWRDILLRPRFDSTAVERWRLREVEAVRRLTDLPGSLAVVEFNRLLFGEHPTGWRMEREDLVPSKVRRERLQALHARIVCPENAVIGVSGDLTTRQVRAALEDALRGWDRCGSALPEPAPPRLGAIPQTYVIHRPIAQSTIVIGQPGGVLLEESPDYFSSRVANWILGGSGFTSRLVQRLRTEEGLAYSAASIWGAAREHERILGAISHTQGEQTVEAARLMIETFRRARVDPPAPDEIELARDAIVNGFVFGFTSPVQVVARQVSYLTDGLPPDWLDRYVGGIREVDYDSVRDVLRRTIDTDSLTLLVVGDTTRFDASTFGPVTYLDARR